MTFREKFEVLVDDIFLLAVFGGVLLSPFFALAYLLISKVF